MDPQRTIELRPSVASMVAAYGLLTFLVCGLALAGVAQIAGSAAHSWSAGAVPLVLSGLILVGGLTLLRRLTRRRTLILDRQGLRLHDGGRDGFTPWSDVRSIVLRRIPKARGTEPAVLVLRAGEPDLTFRSHYSVSPDQLFAELDSYRRAHAIPVSTEARSTDFDLRNWLPER
jgi:hypothetical protein